MLTRSMPPNGSQCTRIVVEIVRKPPDQVGFVLLPRWVVKRFCGCIDRNRRLAKGFVGAVASTNLLLCGFSAMLLARTLARSR